MKRGNKIGKNARELTEETKKKRIKTVSETEMQAKPLWRYYYIQSTHTLFVSCCLLNGIQAQTPSLCISF